MTRREGKCSDRGKCNCVAEREEECTSGSDCCTRGDVCRASEDASLSKRCLPCVIEGGSCQETRQCCPNQSNSTEYFFDCPKATGKCTRTAY